MFDRYSDVRADESHGDIMYWCIMALSSYLQATRDFSILDQVLPYHNAENQHTDPEPLSAHMDRLIALITNSYLPGTSLVPFGGGDWNDSLQPVSAELAARMVSSWTVQMNYQAFTSYRWVLSETNRPEQTNDMDEICRRIRADFNRWLVRDGIVAGYGLRNEDGSFDTLLHPSDTTTGIHYGVLPMNRGVLSEMFTNKQAVDHRKLTEKHLKGPDGVRLMDRPLPYKGGIQHIFQRAESSSYFGREIGLMYTHEHIRYAEMLAVTGDPDAFLKALRQIVPVGYQDVVPAADFRQSNCYYSSSDVIFPNRYQANEHYDDVIDGNVPLKGGWRIYSSGPGICIGLIIGRLFGIRMQAQTITIDPVLPVGLNGLHVQMQLLGHPFTISYNVEARGFGPVAIRCNGMDAAFKREENQYRTGGAIVCKSVLLNNCNQEINRIEIDLL
jgi:cellobiose phosphorylase